jgi:hypothetical protein
MDQIMTYVFYLPLIIKVGFHYLKSGHEIFIPWSWLVVITCLHTVFQVICLYILRGNPAQWLLGLRVVSVYHPEMGLSLSQCFIHALGDKFKIFIGDALYYAAFWSRERRHLINLLAETRVVQKDSSEGLLQPKMVLGTFLFSIALISGFYENVSLIRNSKFKSSGWIIEKL